MQAKWLVINLVLAFLLSLTAGLVYHLLQTEGWTLQPAKSPPTVDAPAPTVVPPRPERVVVAGGLDLYLRTSAVISAEAVLVEPETPQRLTVRADLSDHSEISDTVRKWWQLHPRAAEAVQLEITATLGTIILEEGPQRYRVNGPAEGGDGEATVKAALVLGIPGEATTVLTGQAVQRFVFPTPWEEIPAEHQEMIGRYPTLGPNSKLAAYRTFYTRPSHFYLVHDGNASWRISPHFRLGDFDLQFDFVSPGDPRMTHLPHYIALNPQLVVKLERIVEGLNRVGIPAETLGILAGFRSPYYNSWKSEQPGNGGKYTSKLSTHMYGCAADFYVDLDGDGMMDDLNADGVHDMKDADWVRENVVDALDCDGFPENNGITGACGIYPDHDVPGREPQTPNLHVDIRGYNTVRWDVNLKKGILQTDWAYWDNHACEEPDSGPETE